MRQSKQRHVGPEVTSVSLLFRPHTIVFAGERGRALGPEGQQGLVVGCGDGTAVDIRGQNPRRRRMLRATRGTRRFFFELAGMQDNKKGPPAEAGGPSVRLIQNGASSEAGSGADD